jgi:ABC-2 type transport system permease protein
MSVFPFLIRKEFLQLKRDRKMLPIVIIVPVLQLVVLGYAANMDVRHVPTAVLDRDNSRYSRDLAQSFFATEYFDQKGYLENEAAAEKALVEGSAAAVLVIPEGFSADILRGDTAQLQLLVDGTNSTEGTAILNYANVIVQEFQIELLGAFDDAEFSSVPIEAIPRVWYNPELESKNFMVPGILALLLMVVTMLLSSLAIVKEKELGTLEQINVTPIKPRQLIIGKLVPFVIIGFIDVLLVLAVSYFLFQVPFRGSFFFLFLMSIMFLATTLGLGLFISTVSQNQQQAMITSVFFVMLPMVFLSGFAFSIESMPRPIQFVTYLMPLRYYIVIIRGIFLKGTGITELWDQALILTLFGIGILTLAAARFRKRAE